jgi:hypothetical protein
MTLPTSPNAGPSGLHVRYEKAGLILDALPIPWNADAVIVEANVRLPAAVPREKQDFTMQFSTGAPTAWAEVLMQSTKHAPMRVFFRIPVPVQTCVARIFWREHSLGQVELPILTRAVFEQGFALEMPTLHVALGARTVACQTFVTTQAKSLFASAVVKSASPLAAALTMGLRVEVQRSDATVGLAEIAFTSEQLRMRQALVTVQLPKLRTIGAYDVSWHLATRCLHTQRIRTVSRKTLLRSLRISATRFCVTKDDGTTQIVRSLPARAGQLLLDGVAEVAPIFFVCSGEPGMAGLVPLALRALVGDVLTTTAIEEEVLVTDGPTPVLLGVMPASELSRVKHFTLGCGDANLGNLAVVPAPNAEFNAEGGFAPLDDFLWTAAAEEQLNERLGKLLDEA